MSNRVEIEIPEHLGRRLEIAEYTYGPEIVQARIEQLLEETAPALTQRELMNLRARARRDVRRAAGLCINGVSHGVATHGCLCSRCRRTHKYGAPS